MGAYKNTSPFLDEIIFSLSLLTIRPFVLRYLPWGSPLSLLSFLLLLLQFLPHFQTPLSSIPMPNVLHLVWKLLYLPTVVISERLFMVRNFFSKVSPSFFIQVVGKVLREDTLPADHLPPAPTDLSNAVSLHWSNLITNVDSNFI